MKKANSDRSIANLTPYDQPHLGRSVWQLVNTLVPTVGFWYAAYLSLSISFGLSLVFSLITALLTVRIFILFHDCCHRSFFKSKLANEIVGFVTGVLTLTPYEQWKYTHVVHHATSGNLDKRGVGDIWTLTKEEYLSAPRWKQLFYRVYRNPILMFVIGPFYIFLVDYRFNRPQASWNERINLYLTNLAIVLGIYGLIQAVGLQAFLMVHGPVFYISGMLGIYLFYVQHQYEEAYYADGADWDFVDAALKGSSFFRLPRWLNWFTGSIGFHHVHHLNARVPNYNLRKAHHSKEAFNQVKVFTLKNSFSSMHLVLWDEENQKMIGWRDLRQGRKTAKKDVKVKKIS